VYHFSVEFQNSASIDCCSGSEKYFIDEGKKTLSSFFNMLGVKINELPQVLP